MQSLIAAIALVVGLGGPVHALAGEPQGRLLGSSRMTFFGLDIYDARLWAAPGFVDAGDEPGRVPDQGRLFSAQEFSGSHRLPVWVCRAAVRRAARKRLVAAP